MKFIFTTFFLLCFLLIISNECDAQRSANYSEAEEVITETELRILSWNIQMLPRLLFRLSRGPMRRARLIPEKIINDQIDIIVFQEAFDPRVRRILKRGLKDEYPFRIGPANKGPIGIKTNSGVMIYSKIPIEHLGEIRFADCERDDCLARKGALLVEAEWQGQVFQILGTHLEAGGPATIKANQYHEIRELINEHRKHGVPQFLAGDFNTDKENPVLYPLMLDTLEAEDGPLLSELQYTADELMNDMNQPRKGADAKRKVIDYIFYRGNGTEPKMLERHVRQYISRWCDQYQDLSDHNAVLVRVIFQ